MATVLIVAPVFALIAAGYAAVLFRFVSESAHKGISEFAFSIAIPALLFRTIVVSEFPDVSPWRMWGAYYGALALTWIAALVISALLRERREDREDGVVFAIGSVYGNIVMLGIPLTLSALGNEAAGPMSLILSVNTPLLWLCGILQMEPVNRKRTGSAFAVIRPVLADLARNPLMLGIGFGVVWRFTGLGLNPVVDRTVELLAQAGSPAALIALGITLFRFEIKGEMLSVVVMSALKLLAMPAVAFVLAKLLNLPPTAAGVIVLFAAMPTGANAYIFAVQYQRLVNPVSGAVALCTLLAAVTLPVVVAGIVDEAAVTRRRPRHCHPRRRRSRPGRASTSASTGDGDGHHRPYGSVRRDLLHHAQELRHRSRSRRLRRQWLAALWHGRCRIRPGQLGAKIHAASRRSAGPAAASHGAPVGSPAPASRRCSRRTGRPRSSTCTTISATRSATPPTIHRLGAVNVNVLERGDMIRAGINYRFDWAVGPVVARY